MAAGTAKQRLHVVHAVVLTIVVPHLNLGIEFEQACCIVCLAIIP